MKTEWICTDPATEQYGCKLSDGVYEFKEKDYLQEESSDTNIIQKVIIIADYKQCDIEKHISPYYDSIEEIERIYGDDAEWIIAECIFEQESGLY